MCTLFNSKACASVHLSSENSSSFSVGSDEYELGMNGDDIDEIDDGDEGVLLPWSNFEGI